MSKTKAAVMVVGASGRMGQALAKILPNHHLAAQIGVSRKGKSAGFKSSIENADVQSLKKVDVIIDFSSPAGLIHIANLAAELHLPLISGTTGLSDSDFNTLKKLSKRTAILWSANMSIGIAVLRKSLCALGALKDFDFQVEEVHHKHKKDSPSGTAKVIQSDLEKILKRKLPPAISIRAGGVVGQHKVIAISDLEKIEISHEAFDRSVFAAGAARAAVWILNKKPGFYTIDDVIENG